MRTLSGWMRLWIVAATAIWLTGAWVGLTQIGLPPPDPATVTDREACNKVWREQANYASNSVWGPRCTSDPRTVAVARLHVEGAPSIWRTRMALHLLAWAPIPLLIAGVWMIGRWIQRGFRPHEAT
jgi:hypothetical protein